MPDRVLTFGRYRLERRAGLTSGMREVKLTPKALSLLSQALDVAEHVAAHDLQHLLADAGHDVELRPVGQERENVGGVVYLDVCVDGELPRVAVVVVNVRRELMRERRRGQVVPRRRPVQADRKTKAPRELDPFDRLARIEICACDPVLPQLDRIDVVACVHPHGAHLSVLPA